MTTDTSNLNFGIMQIIIQITAKAQGKFTGGKRAFGYDIEFKSVFA